MTSPLRVAVAGASGIGKHHAKWYDHCGCKVVAFLGSSEASCRATAQNLAELFDFDGRGYTSLDDLLQSEEPDIVDVCTPNYLHFECARDALAAGCHVLIEKPIVWDTSEGSIALCESARQLIDLARDSDRQVGVCTQYAAALPQYQRIHTEQTASSAPVSYEAVMETLSRGRSRSAQEIWIDMGSHPLSLILAWLPDGAIDTRTLAVDFGEHEVRATFDFSSHGSRCACDITVRDRDEGPPTRRFGVNGIVVECEGRADVNGVYQTVLSRQGREVVGKDFMHLLISQFVDTVQGRQPAPIAPAEIGLRNLEIQLQILDAASSAG